MIRNSRELSNCTINDKPFEITEKQEDSTPLTQE